MDLYRLAVLSALATAAGAKAQTTLDVYPQTRALSGGVRTLDRARFFSHVGTLTPPGSGAQGDLNEEMWSPDGLHTSAGRVSTELWSFIAAGLPVDPARPGFIDPGALQSKLQNDYRNFVLSGSRWEQLREADNPILVTSGRNGGQLPDYLDGGTPLPTSYDGLAEFINTYYEEVVYGPNAFLPFDDKRLYYEIVNEPQWTGVAWSDVIDLHRTVTQLIKEVTPQAQVGGASSGDNFEGTGSNSWADMRAMIDDMTTWQTSTGQPVSFDFFTLHNYERYDVAADGTYEQKVFNSPGHVAGIMDLFEAYSNNTLGEVKPFAMTEYGSWNRTNMANGSYGQYARDEQQWDLARDVREQLLVYMDRPDRIVTAVPFIAGRHWQNGVPTNPEGDNVLFEQDATGAWQETILGNTFRMYAPVRGEYVKLGVGDPDLQAVAFRDGNRLYVMLNNLKKTQQTLDLSALGSLGVDAASWSRTYRSGGQNLFLEDVDVTSGWQSLALEAEEGSVLTLTLSGPEVYDVALDSTTTYSADTELPISSGAFLTTSIDADLTDAVSAKLRFGFSSPSGTLPTLTVRVNGDAFQPALQTLEIDDNDDDLLVREIEVPLASLQQGTNQLSFFFPAGFPGASGEISAAVLEVTRSVGDYNGSGVLDAGDLDAQYQQFGAVAAGDEHDLTGDNVVDQADVAEWLALRNAALGDADVDGDLDTRDAVAVLAGQGAAGPRPGWTRGNFDADADVDQLDLAVVVTGFTGAVDGGSTEAVLPSAATSAPRIVYDASTGRLQLAPAGQEVVAFSVSTEQGFVGAGDLSELDAQVGAGAGQADNGAHQVGWVSALLLADIGVDGFGLFDLGALAPTGLDAAGLEAFLSAAEWAASGVGGAFDLVVLPALPGDFNDDGVVDAADYTLLRDTMLSTTELAADADGNGRVDAADRAIWLANFGATTAAVAVPEPSAATLIALLGAVTLPRTARRSRAPSGRSAP